MFQDCLTIPLADVFNLGLKAHALPGRMEKATLEVMAGKASDLDSGSSFLLIFLTSVSINQQPLFGDYLCRRHKKGHGSLEII